VAVANGKTTALACKEAGIVEQTYFRWRKEYGGLQVDQAKRLKEPEQEDSKLKRLVADLSLNNLVLQDFALGKLLSTERRRIAADHAQQKHGMTERRACRLASQPRGTQRYRAIGREDEDALTQAIVQLASTAVMATPDHGVTTASGLAGRQGPRGAHLASRRAEGSAEAEAARQAVAQRWIVRAAEAEAAQPRVEL
jgi:hypothetical protein